MLFLQRKTRQVYDQGRPISKQTTSAQWSRWTKQTKLTSSLLDHRKWRDGPLGMTRENHGRSPRLAHTAKQAEHPQQIFQASGLGDGRTGSGVEAGWNPPESTPNVAQHFQPQDNLVQRGRISTQVTAEVSSSLSSSPWPAIQKSIPKNFFGLGFLCFRAVFFFPSWFTLHSQDIIKVQSEERRGTSSVSVISSTSC